MTESRLRRSMFGSNDQYAQTPENVLQQLQDLFNNGNEMWDPCPVEPQHDALQIEWQTDCAYLNPPYSNIKPFLEKAVEQCKKNNMRIVGLIPCRSVAINNNSPNLTY